MDSLPRLARKDTGARRGLPRGRAVLSLRQRPLPPGRLDSHSEGLTMTIKVGDKVPSVTLGR